MPPPSFLFIATARAQKGGGQNQAIGKSKGGWTTKILALSDALGTLVCFHLLAGNRHDTLGVTPLIKGINFDAILVDTAFDANGRIEEMNERGAHIVLSHRPRHKKPLEIDADMDKWRYLVETVFTKLKEFKALRQDRPKFLTNHLCGHHCHKLSMILNKP